MLKLFVYYKENNITMKRLYKIIILFLVIFFIGIYFTIKSINNYFPSEDSIETVAFYPKILKQATQVSFINFINN